MYNSMRRNKHTIYGVPSVCSLYKPLGNECGRYTHPICRIITCISTLPITAAYKRPILS